MNSIIYKTVAALENAIFSKPWDENAVKRQLAEPFSICLLEYDGEIPAGFALGVKIHGACELYRIGVLPKYRNQGRGKKLLTDFISKCGESVFLEVRAKNAAARKLYESAGFREIAVRKNYYGDDDAVVYTFKEKTNA